MGKGQGKVAVASQSGLTIDAYAEIRERERKNDRDAGFRLGTVHHVTSLERTNKQIMSAIVMEHQKKLPGTRAESKTRAPIIRKILPFAQSRSTRSAEDNPIMNYPKMMYGPNTQKIQHSNASYRCRERWA